MTFVKDMREMLRVMELPKHPLCNEDISVRYPYALGIALLLARADEEFNDKEKSWFRDFTRSLDLPEEHCRKLITEAETVDTLVLYKILPLLEGSKFKKLFFEDLKAAANADGKVVKSESEMISIFRKFASSKNLKPSSAANANNTARSNDSRRRKK